MGIFQQFPYSNFHEMNLDQIIKIMREMQDEWEATKTEWDSYENFINNYFENLDVQEEINNKITKMVETGAFIQLVEPYIPDEVATWLTAHITEPTGVVIDTSLTVSGACADAKAAGDRINTIKSGVTALGNGRIIETDYVWVHGEIDATTGENVSSANPLRTEGFYSTSNVDFIELSDEDQDVRIYYYSDTSGTYVGSVLLHGDNTLSIDKTSPYYRLRLVNTDYSLVADANTVQGYYIAEFQNTIDSLSSLPSEAETIKDDIYPIVDTIPVDSTADNKKLKPDGYGFTDPNYELLKYVVHGGDHIRINGSDHLFQFQNRAQVNDTGYLYRVGDTYGAGDYILIAPPTATHLIVSTKKDVSNVSVYLANDKINNIESVIENNFNDAILTLAGTITTAYINKDGEITSVPGAYRLLQTDVTEGDQLKVTAWTHNENYLYAFYDDNDVLIGGYRNLSGANLQLTDFDVVVPSNATKLAIAGNTVYPPTPSGTKAIKTLQSSYKWAGKKWTVVGDSLTEVNSKTTKHYFDYIAENTGITVVNMGDGGSGYRAEQDINNAFYQRISNVPTDSDVVTIFGSFNDGLTDLGTATDSGTTTVGGCINTTIDNLYTVMPTVQLGIVSPTPWIGDNPYNHPEANAYADLLEAICKRRSIPFLNLYYESNLRPWDATFRQLAYSKDGGNGVHPDETGHEIIASRFMGFLDSLLI